MGVAEKGMARQKEGPDLITPRNKRKGLRNKNFDLIKSCLTVFLFIFICRVNLAYSKSQHPLHDWLIPFFVPRSVRVHWNKYLPPLHTLPCFVSFGTQWVDGNWKYSFYQPAQLGSNSSLQLVCSVRRGNQAHAHTNSGDYADKEKRRLVLTDLIINDPLKYLDTKKATLTDTSLNRVEFSLLKLYSLDKIVIMYL